MTRRRWSRRRAPVQPWAVIAFSATAMAVMLASALASERHAPDWLAQWGFDPVRTAAAFHALASGQFDPALLRLLSSLFAHSGWLHLAGNLAYLWVFGIPVERALGHAGLIVALLLLGAISNLVVALQIPDQERLVLGASGGVSAIIGVYLGLFPNRRIGLWLPLGLFLQFAHIPALLVIGSWFTLQLLYTAFGPVADTVAWWAHTAGFIAGLAVALVLRLALPGLADRVAPERTEY